MSSILDYPMERPMNEPVKPPKPDEVAQIVIQGASIPTLVMRYSSEKKAKEAYEKLRAVWVASENGDTSPIAVVKADMFDSIVNLATISNLSLVIHKVRNKFVPFQL